MPKGPQSRPDPNSPAGLAAFRKAAAAYTAKATRSKAIAIKTLEREGLVKNGKLARLYAPKP